ncbi:uncharacterized protein PAC_12234 [Phialocephala subalpina]|uniref:J domain-containing protein n=1 Tax=Phialocephala subalpina TaxID=576137 RepID=A0A1L7XBJ3_9HELO|nr:uncharacterized protein PAC_12234 [Phialocephala subalpina]
MVKADLSRDYYGDLELAPNADITEIKKQFKKLALIYHPDRNPGRETEVTAKFQKIQSAHEVLIDPTERAKYDANRIRGSSSSFRNSYTGTGGQASGVRGNPWANAGAGWAPPPKPPTARNRAQPPPPPSSGARRYDKFTPPQASAYQAAQEGPQARKAQYEAWENTRHQRGTEHGSGKTWTPPKPPPRRTPQSGREESNAQSYAAPPKPRPGFDEFRDPSSSHSRSQSTNPPPTRKGFMPGTSGGDEPPAPRGNYSTQRDKPSVAPEPPPRQPPQPTQRTATGRTDPLKKFRDPPTTTEPRVSTPYATHGGEKFNPFESAFPSAANINRSKSTRERGEVDKDTFPAFRAGSDTNLSSKNNSPQRARSFAARSTHAPRPSTSESVNLDSSSDEEIVMNKSTARASTRRSNGATPRTTKQATGSTTDSETKAPSKQSRIQQMRQWMKENPGQEPPPNGFGADGPPLRSGQPTPKANGEPSMYASPAPSTPCNRPTPTAFDKRHPSSYSVKLGTVSEDIPSDSRAPAYQNGSVQYPELSKAEMETPPSGVPTSPNSLNAFEEMQRSYVDRLLSNKRQASLGGSFETPNGEALKTEAGSQPHKSMNGDHKDNWTTYRDTTSEAGSPAKKFKTLKHLQATHAYDFSKCKSFWDHHTKMKEEANRRNSSFSFNLNGESFAQTQSPKTNGFSNSAENISTKFTPEDWDGKFEAGASYFQPDKVPSTPQRPRSQSNSRSRGRSPIKVQPPMFGQPPMPSRSEEQTPIESPGGTKFSAEAWKETFKPQTFMPPPMSHRTGPGARKKSLRTTMGGNAAVFDDSETSDEKPLFTGRKKSASPAKPSPVASPEPMDVDTPPIRNTVPQFTNGTNVNGNAEPFKRPAASASPVETELKVAFDDLKVKDIISTLDMPIPPLSPTPPVTEKDIPTRAAYDDYVQRYEKYMAAWDLFNKKFLVHMVARKNQNDALQAMRWTDDQGLQIYRDGLKADQAVMQRWAEHTSVHEAAAKCFVIMKERMQAGEAAEARRPRKKTH